MSLHLFAISIPILQTLPDNKCGCRAMREVVKILPLLQRKVKKIRVGSQRGEHVAPIPQAMAGSWLSIRSLNRSLAPLHHWRIGSTTVWQEPL